MKYIILLICLTVSSYVYCQKDTTTNVPNRILSKIYTDLRVAEYSDSMCKVREKDYGVKLMYYVQSENICNEAMYNDSIVKVELGQNNMNLKKSLNISENKNENLVKSNKLLKFTTVSGFGLFLLTLALL